MKKGFYITALALLFFECNLHEDDFCKEIVLGCHTGEMEFTDTKASPITSISGTYYFGASSGGNSAGTGSETVQWSTSSATVSSSKINTGKMMIGTSTYYNYYVSNANFTTAGNMTVSGNGTDILAARVYNSNNATPSITLNHIFARTGSLTLNVPTGYSASNVSWKIVGVSAVNGTAGTFDMKTQTWSAASTTLSTPIDITSSSDFYLIPGTYEVILTFTMTKDVWSYNYIQKGNISLTQGKINNIIVTTTSADAMEYKFSVSLSSWTSSSFSATLGV